MPCDLFAVSFLATDPPALARFWAQILDRDVSPEGDGSVLPPKERTEFRVRFRPTQEPKTEKNRMHFDLNSSSLAEQEQTVARALALGARHIDIGQRGDEGHVVLADPEGNEFDVLGPGDGFTAGCGFIGALACDGSQTVGYFWSEALGWPLVWDQDLETAIQSPDGGTKISWGGEELPPTRNRMHFDLVPSLGEGRAAELDRLIALGATRVEGAHPDGYPVPLADPDGNEFWLRSD